MDKIYWSIFQNALNFTAPDCKVFEVRLKNKQKWWKFWHWKQQSVDVRTARGIEKMLNWVIRQPEIMESIFTDEKRGVGK